MSEDYPKLKHISAQVEITTWEDLKVLCYLEGWYIADALNEALRHWVAMKREQLHKEQQKQLIRRERYEDI